MKIFFSAKQNAFFNEDLHGSRLIEEADPGDQALNIMVPNPDCKLPPEGELVEVSASEHAAIFFDLSSGAILSSDDKGFPIAIPSPGPTPEQLLDSAIRKRDSLLALAAIRIAPLQYAADLDEASDEDLALLKLWKKYGSAVNKTETKPGWPESPQWPDPPVPLE